MKKSKLRRILVYIVPFVVLILTLTLVCCSATRDFKKGFEKGLKGEVGKVEEEIVEEPTIVEKEVVGESTIADADAEYIGTSMVMHFIMTEGLMKFEEACQDYANGKISTSEYKVIIKEYIETVEYCYDMYLELEPSGELEKSYDMEGKAMDHFLNSTTFLQRYLETDDIGEEVEYLDKSLAEFELGIEYINKATEQIKKLTE